LREEAYESVEKTKKSFKDHRENDRCRYQKKEWLTSHISIKSIDTGKISLIRKCEVLLNLSFLYYPYNILKDPME